MEQPMHDAAGVEIRIFQSATDYAVFVLVEKGDTSLQEMWQVGNPKHIKKKGLVWNFFFTEELPRYELSANQPTIPFIPSWPGQHQNI